MTIEDLIKHGTEQFYYSKTNIIGYGCIFAASTSYLRLAEHERYSQVSAVECPPRELVQPSKALLSRWNASYFVSRN